MINTTLFFTTMSTINTQILSKFVSFLKSASVTWRSCGCSSPGLRKCFSQLAYVLLHPGATPHRLWDRTAAHAAASVAPTTPGRARRHQTLHQDRAWWAHSEPLLQTMLSTDDASRREYAMSKILAIGGLEEALRKDQQALDTMQYPSRSI